MRLLEQAGWPCQRQSRCHLPEGCNGDDSDIVAYVHGVERAHHRVRIRPLDRCLPAGQVEAYQILVADLGIEVES